jgi:hypothetical protein
MTIFFHRILEAVMKQTKKIQPSKKKQRKKRLNQNQRNTTFKSTSDALSSILNGPKSDGKAKEEKEMTMLREIRKFKW